MINKAKGNNKMMKYMDKKFMEKLRNDEHYNQMSKDMLKDTINSLTDRLYWLVEFEKYVKTKNSKLYNEAKLYANEIEEGCI